MAAVFSFFVFFTTVFAVNTLGCQFYPAGEYLRFVRVPENLPVGEEVLQVEVHPRRNLTIQSVDKADDVKFFRYDAVNRTVVSIRLAESLEDLVDSAVPRNVLKFRLICDYDDGDDTITSYLSITVYVEDVNDHSPVFQGTPYIVTVDELTPTGLTIFRGIHATDNDKPNTPNSDVQYTIMGGNEKGKFALENSPRASLILRRPLDYDSGDNKFLLTIVASDRGNEPRNATTTVQIAVTDSDDLSPRFTRDVYKTQVTEFYPITGKRIHQQLHFDPRIEAYDQDRMINASIQYDVIAGNERHLFAIDQNNGTLFLERELDLDSLPGNTFTLQIQASQLDNPLKTGVARVEVELLDINDNLPQFEVDLYNISIVENLPNGFSVLQVIATDQDQGDNGEFVYHLMDPSQAFSIDGRSGWLTVRNQAKLDREQRPSLSMRVLAREKLPSVVTPPSDAYVAVEVTLLDANDNNPTFIPSNLYEFTAPIDVNVGQVVGRVEAIDPDLGRNGMVLYEMKRSNNITTSNRGPQMFTVEAQTGRITVVEPPSGPGKHTLFVEASDQPANPSERRFSLAVVSIHVVETGKTETIPDFVGAPYEFWVGSDVPIGTSVGQVRVSEAIDGKTIIYDLLHSYNEGVPFAVEERLGTITVVDDMDKYDRTLYDFEAVVTDEMTLTLITNVTIHVVQSDSIFQSSNLAKDLELRVRENQSGAFIGQLITTAGNVTLPSSYWKMMKFVIANEPDVLQKFAISPDGTLYTQRGLDRERKDSYQLTIIAENSRALRALFRVHVIVEDENDNPPMFERPWYVGHIREDCTPGCKVAMETDIKVHDADDGVNSEFTLTLRGNDSQLFHLNTSTGSVVLNGLLDRESKHEYSFKVVATDRGNLSSETSLTIYVDDVNDNIPRFVHLMVHSGDMVELDNSTVSSQQIVVYRNSTVIKLETSLDDQILSTVPTIKVSETVMVGFVVVRVMAEDKDSGENATISYKLDSEAYLPKFEASSSLFNTHHFTLHPITGDISVAAVLPPETMFQLNMSATDDGGLSQHILLKIFVKDVNNNPPMFEKSRYVFEIEEGDYTGRGVGQLIATDPDFGDNANISYSLLLKRNNSSIQFPFSIKDTGVLSVDSILDREKQSLYNFRVMAQDRGPVNRRLRSTVDVEIHVLDVNDNAPVFYGHDRVIQMLATELGDPSIKQSSDFEPTVFVPVYTASVQENNAPGITVGRVFANDSDSLVNGNGMILYRIQHRNSQPHLFAIDSKDGTVSTTMSLDYEVQTQHNVTVVASDLGHPSLSSTALLIVNVIDVSEQNQETSSPVFTHRYYELEVDENSAVPLQLLTVSVSEEYRQKAKNSLHFSVAPGVDSSLFDVAQHNGTVMLVSSPDREVQDKLQVVIRVEPAKQPRGFLQVIYPVQTSDLAPNEARVVVRVKDANDNSPHFSLNGRPLVAAIPTTANYGYPIARLQATDADTGLNAEIRYQILGGEAGYFSVDPYSGHIRAVASFTHYAGRVFGFDVKATDRAGAHDGRSAIANVFVYVLHEHKKLALVMAAKPIDVEANIDNIIRALSNVTALDVRLRMLEPHQEDGKFTDNTDMYVYAVDPVMNVIVDSDSLRDVLTAKEIEVKRILEPLHLMGVVGSGFPASPPLRTTPHSRAPLLTGLEVATIALGCVVFLGALTAAICVTCAHKKRNRFRSMGRSASVFRKKLEVGFPISNIDIALAAKSRMDCKPRSLFHPSAFIEDSTDSYASNRSDCNRHHRRTSHRHGPLCVRHHSRRLPTRSPSTTMLEMSLASLHSSARDSGIGDPTRIRTRCPCGHSTSHSSANSSNGSYEDSLKSLHRHHSHSSGGSGGVGAGGSGGAGTGNGNCNHDFATISRHRRQESSGTALMQPPPPPFSTPALARRPSERIIIPR